MGTLEKLKARRESIIEEIRTLEQMRRGSLVEQYVETVGRDGAKARRGPYVLFSFKEKKKTFSKRITNPRHVAIYREQIQAFRRFQELAAELVCIGEQIADLGVTGREGVKKTKHSEWKKRPR
jgi:hypothetical protein